MRAAVVCAAAAVRTLDLDNNCTMVKCWEDGAWGVLPYMTNSLAVNHVLGGSPPPFPFAPGEARWDGSCCPPCSSARVPSRADMTKKEETKRNQKKPKEPKRNQKEENKKKDRDWLEKGCVFCTAVLTQKQRKE